MLSVMQDDLQPMANTTGEDVKKPPEQVKTTNRR